MTPRRHLIAVVGDSRLAEGCPTERAAEALGERLVDAGYRVLTGGLGGVMEAACRGTRRSAAYRPGDTVGLLPGHSAQDANSSVDIAIPTGLDHGRNVLVAHADAVIALGGGAGTLSEIALAWVHHRLVIAFRGEGWAGRLADQRIDERARYPGIAHDRVYGVGTPDEAVMRLGELLPLYQREHHGIGSRRP